MLKRPMYGRDAEYNIPWENIANMARFALVVAHRAKGPCNMVHTNQEERWEALAMFPSQQSPHRIFSILRYEPAVA